MTAKLLKHEYLRTRKPIVGAWLGAACLILVGCLMAWTGWIGLSTLGFMMVILAVFVLMPAVQLYLGIDYWTSSYRRTGYFTQSLPIKGATIFWVKLLWATIVSVATFLVTSLLALFAFPVISRIMGGESVNGWALLGQVWQRLAELMPWWAIILAVLFGFVLLMTLVVQLFFVASIGSKEPMNRWGIGGPILVMVVLYFAQQFINFIAIIAIPIGLEMDPLGFVNTSFLQALMADSEMLNVMPFGFVPVMVIIPALLLWRTVVSWRKKVALV